MADKSPKEIKALMESQGMKPDRHNWLYSFMNTMYQETGLGPIRTTIHLVAYCKQCDQTVTVLAPIDYAGNAKLNRAGIPKLGCDWNGEEY